MGVKGGRASLQSAMIWALSMEGISLGPSSTEDAATRSSFRPLRYVAAGEWREAAECAVKQSPVGRREARTQKEKGRKGA